MSKPASSSPSVDLQFLSHVWILTVDELTQLFARKRAIIAFILYVIVVGFVVYGFSSVDQTITAFLKEQNAPRLNAKQILESLKDFPQKEMIKTLLEWPITFPLFQFFAVIWMSELIAIVSCDMISLDKERGTLRFLFLRTSRSALFVAKYLSHFLLYVTVHALSLAVLVATTIYMSNELTVADCLSPLTLYSLSLMPLIALTLAITLLASATSSSIIGALLKIHIFWLPIFFLLAYSFIEVFSWKTIVGIIAPFDNFFLANLVGNLSLTAIILVGSFRLFRNAEV